MCCFKRYCLANLLSHLSHGYILFSWGKCFNSMWSPRANLFPNVFSQIWHLQIVKRINLDSSYKRSHGHRQLLTWIYPDSNVRWCGPTNPHDRKTACCSMLDSLPYDGPSGNANVYRQNWWTLFRKFRRPSENIRLWVHLPRGVSGLFPLFLGPPLQYLPVFFPRVFHGVNERLLVV